MPKHTIEDTVRDLVDVFQAGKIRNPMRDSRFSHILTGGKIMKTKMILQEISLATSGEAAACKPIIDKFGFKNIGIITNLWFLAVAYEP